ncbi:penicillin-binding protein activator [Alteromonas sp. D210916BOD_24]|uniref:penicillin-binding protein activator n=1 Tax=Alteromonas sp. D210916BOD_24 TaxID=3157618 RepID=UPI00399CDEB5
MRHFGQAGKFFTLSTIAAVLTLTGCGSTPKPQSNDRVIAPTPVESTVVNETLTPAHLLVEAQKVWTQSRDKDKRDALLLQAADLYLQQGKPLLAQQILYEVKESGLSTFNQSHYSLLMATSYASSTDVPPQDLLDMLAQVSNEGDVGYQKAQLQTQLYSRQGNWVAAADSLLRTQTPDEIKVEQVWQWITSQPSATLVNVGKHYTSLSPFITLRELTEENASSPELLADTLRQFQHVYRAHLLGHTLPEEVLMATQLTQASTNDIAVLLPLSGRLGRTGEVVKNGIMAAYYKDVELRRDEHHLPSLRFIDTNESDTEQLIEQIGNTKFIIGPLLKDTVESLIPALPVGVNVLALNRPEDLASEAQRHQKAPSSFAQSAALDSGTVNRSFPSEMASLSLTTAINYYGLAPEDEAKQLAEFIFSKGYRAPIVISAQSSLYQRMDTTFKAHWRRLNNAENKQRTNITSVTFNDSNSLREGITQALDVAQSNERINQIEYMTNDEVYNMPRSRRDIDAIVAFASPQDTELLNPIIEASLNPYDGKQVPVYATSRSMDYDSGKNQWRDLQNVHFIDMPWLMPQHNWQHLEKEVEKAWQNQNTMQKRLFAFGYDAYQLLPQLGMLNTLQYLTHEGLTGTLSVNEFGEVVRKQPQAIIRNEQVQMLSE